MDRVKECNGDDYDYEQYILQHLECHLVFVGVNDFTEHLLHVPDDWET